MDDAFFVSRCQPTRNLDSVLNRRPHPWRAGHQEVAERLALEEFGDDIRCARMCPDVVNDQNVGMIERRNRSSFLLETLESFRIAGETGTDHLDRHIACEARIACPIHFPHSTGTYRVHDLVGTDSRIGSERHAGNIWRNLRGIIDTPPRCPKCRSHRQASGTRTDVASNHDVHEGLRRTGCLQKFCALRDLRAFRGSKRPTLATVDDD